MGWMGEGVMGDPEGSLSAVGHEMAGDGQS